MSDKKKIKKKLIIEGGIAFLIALSPILHYWWKYLPTEETLSFIGMEFTSNGFEDVSDAFYYYLLKITPLVLLVVWFVTCKHWWYHVLIIPITMFSFQCIGAINDDIVFMDEFQIIYLLPIMAIVFPSIYLIRARMFNKINDHDKTMEELEEEFMIKPKTVWGKVKQYF